MACPIVCNRPIAYRVQCGSRSICTCDLTACKRVAYETLARETRETGEMVLTTKETPTRAEVKAFTERLETSIAKQTEILHKCQRMLHTDILR